MNPNARRIAILGAALSAVALSSVASAQDTSELTRAMGIDQKLGDAVPKEPMFLDETGATRTFGSVLKGRPVLVVPISLRCHGGCQILLEGLQKTLYRAENPNARALIKKEGRNRLTVGRDFDIVVLSLDPRETPTDAAETKNAFEKKVGYEAEPFTVLTGSLANIRKVTDAIGFRYLYQPERNVLDNATGSVLLTPDGHISSYTIANDFPTVVLERNLETAGANGIGTKADTSQMFGCVQLDPSIVVKRGKIESVYNVAGVLTLAGLVGWIVSMLRSERAKNRDLGGQPRGA